MANVLLVHTDGRDHIFETLPVLLSKVKLSAGSHEPAFDHKIICDDSGSRRNVWRLNSAFPDFKVISTGNRRGFGGAIRFAWDFVRKIENVRWVFSTEDDFILKHEVSLKSMQRILKAHPEVAQMAFVRNPVNEKEIAAGGLLASYPTEAWRQWSLWIEHQAFFTTNMYFASAKLLKREWPDGPQSEGRFSIDLFKDGLSCGYWGRIDQAPAIEHIGHKRVGKGY